jgi:hypothetical protein
MPSVRRELLEQATPRKKNESSISKYHTINNNSI